MRRVGVVFLLLLLLGACGTAQPAVSSEPEPMTFCRLFPDPLFAQAVANLFGKSADDTTTHEELASYEGELQLMPGELKSIEGIGLLTGITALNNSKNCLEELPAEIGNCVHLQRLSLGKSYELRRLPPEIGALKQLQYLNLGLTKLEALPKEIGECRALETLYLARTSITALPEEIGNLTQLKVLDVHSNHLTAVPDSICSLTALEDLDISYTQLHVLPEDLGNLTNLQRLDLFGLGLSTLPSSLKGMKNLRYLNVYDNHALDEAYKNWFSEKVYTCGDDPRNDPA